MILSSTFMFGAVVAKKDRSKTIIIINLRQFDVVNIYN